ncbi:Translin family-domain-containing protein [Phycomyces nitens]|nr:Translin family-domain-containing protein [Phycomyces nitens]
MDNHTDKKPKTKTELHVFFETCRDSIDDQNDRRERIMKISRDITALSKKLIFALHRTTQVPTKTPDYSEIRTKQAAIMGLFRNLALDTTGSNYYRYSRSFSGGLEEYIEAIAFFHYLEHGTLLTKDQVDQSFTDDSKMWLKVKTEDYLLGIADFTGEMMRYAIQAVSSGSYEKAMEICRFLRMINSDFEIMCVTLPQLRKKMPTLISCICKVEKACYDHRILGSEYPEEIFRDIIRAHQESYEAV